MVRSCLLRRICYAEQDQECHDRTVFDDCTDGESWRWPAREGSAWPIAQRFAPLRATPGKTSPKETDPHQDDQANGRNETQGDVGRLRHVLSKSRPLQRSAAVSAAAAGEWRSLRLQRTE